MIGTEPEALAHIRKELAIHNIRSSPGKGRRDPLLLPSTGAAEKIRQTTFNRIQTGISELK